jgi:glycerol-3-phosphate dehydrogenase (NAD(P)+)
MENKTITIIGAGRIGQVMGKILQKSGNNVFYWDKESDLAKKMNGGKDLALPEIMIQSEFVFLCVPSKNLREAILFTNKYLARNSVVITLAKGLEEKTYKTSSEILADLLPNSQAWAIMGGPMLAKELEKGELTSAMIGANKKSAGEKVVELFSNTNIACAYTPDALGVALAGVLKNIYALGLGMISGLDYGENTKGTYAVRAIGEMIKVGKSLGAKEITLMSPAGLGDFIATGFSPLSSNHGVGRLLAQGKAIEKPSEGLISLPSLLHRLGKNSSKYPILAVIHRLILGETKDFTTLIK